MRLRKCRPSCTSRGILVCRILEKSFSIALATPTYLTSPLQPKPMQQYDSSHCSNDHTSCIFPYNCFQVVSLHPQKNFRVSSTDFDLHTTTHAEPFTLPHFCWMPFFIFLQLVQFLRLTLGHLHLLTFSISLSLLSLLTLILNFLFSCHYS